MRGPRKTPGSWRESPNNNDDDADNNNINNNNNNNNELINDDGYNLWLCMRLNDLTPRFNKHFTY